MDDLPSSINNAIKHDSQGSTRSHWIDNGKKQEIIYLTGLPEGASSSERKFQE